MHSETLSGKKVLVIGLGLSGRSAAQFLLFHGASVEGVDRNAEALSANPEIQLLKNRGLTVTPETSSISLQHFDFILLSPGIPNSHPLVQAASQLDKPVMGEVELGCRMSNNPMLGITGTNGKTTVTLLVTHVLNACGQPAAALGNVGVPFTQELLTIPSEDTIVLELSSYQLETLYQPSLNAAVLLNITPDHLDRYGSMESYAAAKCGMERCLKPNAPFYMEESAWETFGHLLSKRKPLLYGYSKTSHITTDLAAVFQEGRKVFELPSALKGKKSHDLENLLAAYALCSARGISGEDFIQAWMTFKKPSHRIEWVAEHKGIKFYDDSKGTNLDAVIRAVQFLEGPMILIAGGVDKGAAYTPWIEVFKNKVKSICAIGQAAAKIEAQLSSSIPVVIVDSLEEAVEQAVRQAQKGDTVLLSPGCSSYDMFKDYVERGEKFQQIVRNWIRDQG